MKSTLLAIALLINCVRLRRTHTTPTCRVTDADATRLLGYVRDLVSSAETARVSIRNDLGLVKMDSTKVVLVTANTVCNKVATGINTAFKKPGLIRQLYVVKAGSIYTAQDPAHPAGEWWPTITLDKNYVYKASVLAP